MELPVDVLYPYFMVQKEMVSAKPPKGLVGRGVSWLVAQLLPYPPLSAGFSCNLLLAPISPLTHSLICTSVERSQPWEEHSR